MVVRRDGRVETLGRPGTLLGILPDPELDDAGLPLERGDALVLYTDGVTDADAPEHAFGAEDVARLLVGLAGRSAEAIAERLEAAALAAAGDEPRDDIAILVARIRD
jgi:serine phosphatase RsbU (regulator of sigma subunit)